MPQHLSGAELAVGYDDRSRLFGWREIFVIGGMTTVLGVHGDDALARRLVDLGFWPGTEVEVVHSAPFRGPLLCRLHGYRLALRRDEAARVIVGAPGTPP